jgi:transposase InsO family protein
MAGDVLGRAWPEPEERQDLIAFVERMTKLDSHTQADILARLGLDRKRLARWKEKGDEPSIPYRPKSLDGTLIQEEKSMICNYYLQHPGDGYRRCTYMMQDEKLIGVSPATVYKVLKEGEVLRQAQNLPGRKGFDQPSAPHHHWHTDFTAIKAGDRYYHLISVIDGYSRAVLSFGIYAQATSFEAQLVVQKACELYNPEQTALISDNGSTFTAKRFLKFLKGHNITSRFTSPYHPQSNGKIERWHKSIKWEAIYPGSPVTEDELRRIIETFVSNYNKNRLHAAIGYLAPLDKLEGRGEAIHAARKAFLLEQRALRRQRSA